MRPPDPDDLGTEFSSPFTVSCIYNIINGRMLAGRSTVVSTNLSQQELLARYGGTDHLPHNRDIPAAGVFGAGYPPVEAPGKNPGEPVLAWMVTNLSAFLTYHPISGTNANAFGKGPQSMGQAACGRHGDLRAGRFQVRGSLPGKDMEWDYGQSRKTMHGVHESAAG